MRVITPVVQNRSRSTPPPLYAAVLARAPLAPAKPLLCPKLPLEAKFDYYDIAAAHKIVKMDVGIAYATMRKV